MHSSSTRRPRRAVSLTAAGAMAAAMAVTIPAGADEPGSAWPQHSADAGNTTQGVTTGPEDPGLQWLVDLADVESEVAPDGYSVGSAIERFGNLNRPILGPDGTLIMRADNNDVGGTDGGQVLLGLSPDDGEVLWEIPYVRPSCAQAIDSQDRLWLAHRGGEFHAFDPDTGEAIDGTLIEPADERAECNNAAIHIGGDREHLVHFRVSNQGDRVEAIDIHDDTPTSAWDVNLRDDITEVDEILDGSQPREGVITGDSVIFAGVHEQDDVETPRLVELSLETGEVIDHVDLPTFGGATGSDLSSANLLLTDDTLIIGVQRSTGRDGHGYLAAYDLDNGFGEPSWVQESEDESGPTRLTLGDGVVHANDGDGFVAAYDLDDGSTHWDGLEVVERGGGMNYEAVSDATGRLFTLTTFASGSDGRAVTGVSADGEIEWQAPRGLIRQEADLVEDDLPSSSLRLGPIGEDGTLYVFREGTVFAIDDSGGLDAGCQLPFEDVDSDTNVHATNICRLVEAGITSGLSDTEYGPGNPVTRQQMAAFLTRALDLPTRAGSDFDDVDADSVFAPYINALVDAEITQGVGGNAFAPTAELDRQQMATFLARAADLDGVDGSGFDDVAEDNVHRENIYAVLDADITQGVSSSRFAPDRVVQRDQMASFLMRMVDYLDAN